jgi:cell wall-associated NlpC family hydrolase
MRVMRTGETAGIAGVLTVLLLAAGCAGTPARDPRGHGGIVPEPAEPAAVEAPPAPGDQRAPIADLALAMVGVPYRYGGAHPSEGFDCSGLVYYTYTSNGQAVPRTSRGQFDIAHKITLAQAAEGDLVFFRDQEKLSHVGIYLGDGRFVHAPSSGGSVRVADIHAPYYQRHLVAVGRLMP